GAAVAGDSPYEVRRPPPDPEGQRKVLRHGENRECAPDGLSRRAHDLEPAPYQRADLVADLEAGEPLGREIRFERAIDLLDVDVDHSRLALRHREPRLDRVDT